MACGDNLAPTQPHDASTTPTDSQVGSDAEGGDAGVDAAPDAPPDAPPDAFTGADGIAAARATADGTGLSLTIPNVIVTYIKPALGDPAFDSAGFTVQATQTGPALMIAVDPTTLSPAPAVGDVVSFTITEMITNHGQRRAAAITDWTRVSQGANVAALIQNVTTATDLVSAVSDYDSEIIDATLNITGNFVSAGTAFRGATVETTAIMGDSLLRLRMPTTVVNANDVVTGCTITLHGTPVSLFVNSTPATEAQLHAFTAADFTLSNCPAPTLNSATALSSTSVRFTFSRNIDPASVLTDGSQFTFDNGLTASAASVSGKTVTVTTSSQVGGLTYTGTVASSVLDTAGGVVAPPRTATFTGYQVPAVLRINEVNANIASSCDLIELRVIESGTIGGFFLRERNNQTLITFPSMNVTKNQFIVVHINGTSGTTSTCNPGGSANETLTTIDQLSVTYAANYDTAFDLYSTDSGLTNTDNVFTLYDNTNAIMDAVFVANDAAGTAASDSETQAATVAAAGQWQIPNNGGVPAGGFIDDVFRANAVIDLDATGTTKTGTSLQRLDNTDDNDKDDWAVGGVAQTWGALNAGQTAL